MSLRVVEVDVPSLLMRAPHGKPKLGGPPLSLRIGRLLVRLAKKAAFRRCLGHLRLWWAIAFRLARFTVRARPVPLRVP